MSDGIDEKLLAPGGTAGEGDGSIMLTEFLLVYVHGSMKDRE